MKNIVALFLLFPAVALAGIEEYTVNGETRLYDTACYWNTPDKIVPSPDGGGYNVVVAVTREECRVHGAFAKVNIYKYDFVTGGTILFRGNEWLSEERAILRKQKLDSKYKNVLNAGFATQVVTLEKREF
jgi:hypothetical protein